MLEALTTSPDEATAAIIDIVEGNRSAPPVRALLASALKVCPSDSQIQSCAGRLAASDGKFDLAIAFFSAAHRLSPSNPDHTLALGVCLKHQNRLHDALPFLRTAHHEQPTARSTRVLADAEFEADHPDLALPLLSQLLTSTPHDVSLRLRLAETFNQLGDNAKAGEIISAGLLLTPDSPSLYMGLAQTMEDDGNSSAAEQAYHAALTMRPGWPTALAGLLGLKRSKASPELLEIAQSLVDSAATPDNERALLGYALGKALDSKGSYSEALKAWNIANQSREALVGRFDPDWLARHVHTLETTLPASISPTGRNSDWQMVFVVGMPRSGTTLTETILSAHPGVHGCGELPDLPRLTFELGPGWPATLADMSSQELASMRSAYLRSASRHARPGQKVLVDKAPLNFFQLSLAQTLFPSAKVIWCRRDKRDVALSIYSENFSPTSTFSTSLTGITAYQDAEERLLRLWERTLSLPIYVQDYAELASNPHDGAKKLIEFIDLKWDEDVLRAHETAGTVQTPSRWQVREPIHTRSIGRWKNYPELFPQA